MKANIARTPILRRGHEDYCCCYTTTLVATSADAATTCPAAVAAITVNAVTPAAFNTTVTITAAVTIIAKVQLLFL